jgi:ubiquinone/menaquinone biosynthesis C-methylase UbiE
MAQPIRWENVCSVFDQKAQTWDVKKNDLIVVGCDRPLDEYLGKTLQSGQCCVDLGCGDGGAVAKNSARWMSGTAILVDASPAMLNKAAAAPGYGKRIRKILVRANALRTPLASGCADIVILRQLLQHVPVPQLVLNEAARLVKPGGEVLVQVPGPAYLFELDPFVEHEQDKIGRFSKQELKTLFSNSGLSVSVSSHCFELRFPGGSVDALAFFLSIALLEKLIDYRPNGPEVLRALLRAPVVRNLVSSQSGVVVAGEYLFGRATK